MLEELKTMIANMKTYIGEIEKKISEIEIASKTANVTEQNPIDEYTAAKERLAYLEREANKPTVMADVYGDRMLAEAAELRKKISYMETKENVMPTASSIMKSTGLEVCRKAKYNVQIELACYPITDRTPLMQGFEAKEIDGTMYAVKSGVNVLEQNNWTTSPAKPYIVTGTVGERWPIKPSNLSAYDVNPSTIGINPVTVSTKDPSNQEFMSAMHIPEGTNISVVPSWAFREDGTIDNTQVMIANSVDSVVSHNGGDYVVAKHIDGAPEYMDLPSELRNTKEMADKYDPRIINGSIMETTYDHALTKDEIIAKYENLGRSIA